MKNHNFPIGKGKHWKNPSEIENKLFEYLSGRQFDDLSIIVTFAGEGKGSGWIYDKWTVSFQRCRKESIQFDYRTGIAHRGKDKIGRPCQATPHIAGIMYCLLSDAEANEMSFNDWCDTYGCDNDSMKDFKIYQDCCDTARKIRIIFNGQQVAEMRNILQDY